ncbi:MAG: IS605 OrfB-like transposable element containing RNAse H-like and Zn finger domain [Candidatus Methanohalarchaeum thermophilum]|uniref:IS605 OrfB-like transposable element containing RNAse H-like and Zn finger domain n=1 Tax=Methanohalarchaeum thermophilum TaxID=1903181 RepID=A0A1Q6DV76_METT1|nr:MAG: IS605 OrfB-like transposable element containing RNAse H-like and Zn finger domain [Candidatus Methanohalarchaeum thermophilum]
MKKKKNQLRQREGAWLGIDLGLDNLATCVDHFGRSFILDGRLLIIVQQVVEQRSS